MDPMDFILHNHGRNAAHYDPVHAASSPWASRPPNPGSYPWQQQAAAIPPPFAHHMMQPLSFSDPFQLAQNPGLPPTTLGFENTTQQGPFGAPVAQRNHEHGPVHMSGPAASLSTGQTDPTIGIAPAAPRTYQPFAARPLSFQPPVGLGMAPHGGGGAAAAAAAAEPNSLPRAPSSASTLTAATYPHYHISQFTASSPAQPPHPAQSRRSHHSTSSTPARVYRPDLSTSNRSPPAGLGSRRTHGRLRRSLPSRFTGSEARRGEEDDDIDRQLFLEQLVHHSTAGMPPNMDGQVMDDAIVRQIQLVRGTASSKMVASKMALRTMQSVRIEDLDETDRTCVICYNEYGVQTPEGINEAPLRLPRCKHIFGDHCIKKWLEDSDSCPYCRDKLHAEPKYHSTSHPAFVHMMRSRGLPIPVGMNATGGDMFYRAAAPVSTNAGDTSSPTLPGQPRTRRSPPSDPSEQQRRTRPRHNNTEARRPSPSPEHSAQPVVAPPSRSENNTPGSTAHPSQPGAMPTSAQTPGFASSSGRVSFGGAPVPTRWGGRGHGAHATAPIAGPGIQRPRRSGQAVQTTGGALTSSAGAGAERTSTPSMLPNPLQSPGGVLLDEQSDQPTNSSPQPDGRVLRNRPW